MNHRLLDDTPPRPPSHPSHFLSEESPFGSEIAASEDIDDLLSKSSLHKLHLACYDDCIFNDLPQYLVRISDMRLYNRGELWKIFRPLALDTLNIDLRNARRTMEHAGEAQLTKNYKVAMWRVSRSRSRDPDMDGDRKIGQHQATPQIRDILASLGRRRARVQGYVEQGSWPTAYSKVLGIPETPAFLRRGKAVWLRVRLVRHVLYQQGEQL